MPAHHQVYHEHKGVSAYLFEKLGLRRPESHIDEVQGKGRSD